MPNKNDDSMITFEPFDDSDKLNDTVVKEVDNTIIVEKNLSPQKTIILSIIIGLVLAFCVIFIDLLLFSQN